jgi:hypothetical protein
VYVCGVSSLSPFFIIILWYFFLFVYRNHLSTEMTEWQNREESCKTLRTVSFTDTVGVLWYTLYTAQRGGRGGDGGSGNDKDISDAQCTSSFFKAAGAEEKRGGATGEVDWVLLAAHVYALTRELHTDADVRRIVVHDVFEGRFGGNAAAMTTTLAATYHALLMSRIQADEEEEGRAVVVAAVSAPATASMTASTTTNGVAVAAGASAAGVSPCVSAVVQQQSTRPSSPELAPACASSSSSLLSSDAQQRGSTGVSGLQVPITAGITYRSPHMNKSASPAPPLLTETRDSPHHPAASPPAAPSIPTRAGQSSHDSALHNSPQRGSEGEGVAGSGGYPAAAAAAAQMAASHPPPPPLSSPPPTAGGDRFGGSGGSARTSTAPCGGASPAPPPPVFPSPFAIEPDPLDAPWYALWCSLPSQQARVQLQRLRFHTPLPIEDFSSLLEQFFLVDGADDFLNPVHAATIMEFAGVRSGPYHSIVRAPLSLAEVRRYITESHRQYARAVTAHHEHSSDNKPNPFPSSSDGTLGSSSIHVVKASSEKGHHYRPHDFISTSDDHRNGAGAVADVHALLQWTASNERRVLTIAELERSIWHIAANCVAFNAPESRYPRTARRFAAACIAIITRYCERQMGAFLLNT